MDEVKAIVMDLRSSQMQARMLKWTFVIIVPIVIAAFGAIFAVSLAAAELSKESHVTSDGLLASASGDGSIVKTEVAMEAVPMYVAPVLPLISLQAVKQLSVTYQHPVYQTTTAEVLQVRRWLLSEK